MLEVPAYKRVQLQDSCDGDVLRIGKVLWR